MQVLVKLSIEDIQKLIRDHLHKEGYTAKTVHFIIQETGSDMRGLDLHQELVGVEVATERRTD